MSRAEVQAARKKEKKKGGIGAWLYRIVIVILIGVMGYSGYNIYRIYSEYETGTVIYEDFADEVGAGKIDDTDNSRLHLDWAGLTEKNEDVSAWMRCKDTVINYPIVSGEKWDDEHSFSEYYLANTITGEYNGKGTIFIDYNCTDPFKRFLTIMYGHRMKDGSMFKPLVNYFEEGGIEYYKNHPTIELYTPSQNYDMHVFACARVSETDMSVYRYNFSDAWGEIDPAEKQAYLDHVQEINEFWADPEVTVSVDDNIVLMSTCTELVDDNRLVIWAKLIPVD